MGSSPRSLPTRAADVAPAVPPVQTTVVVVAAIVAGALFVALLPYGGRHAALLPIGLALGVTLYHGAFGFSGTYRRALATGNISGIAAQLIMLAVAVVLFAPILAAGNVFGQSVAGAVAPVSVSMAFGAFLFGVGMQLGGGCASGTLYTAGGGSVRMMVVLVFFCLGGFWASLDLSGWNQLPGIGAVSLAQNLGWPSAVAAQLVLLAAIYALLRRIGGQIREPLWDVSALTWRRLARGPWPLALSAVLLALLNVTTLIVAGHPWSITWAFTLWPAKLLTAAGWDASTSSFWSGAFQQAALARPLLADNVSVMNIGILLGALVAAALAGRLKPNFVIPLASLAAAVVGGLMMGYGARLAFGCNIGAFFSGVASASLHGWVWIAAAVPGTLIGVRLRRVFLLPP